MGIDCFLNSVNVQIFLNAYKIYYIITINNINPYIVLIYYEVNYKTIFILLTVVNNTG